MLVTSIRRVKQIANYFAAVQTPFQKTENNATLGFHEQLLNKEGKRSDYFTINVNSQDFVFSAEFNTEKVEIFEEEKFENRGEKIKSIRRQTVFKKHVISEFVGQDIDFKKVLRRASVIVPNSEVDTAHKRRVTVKFLRDDALQENSESSVESDKDKEEDQFAHLATEFAADAAKAAEEAKIDKDLLAKDELVTATLEEFEDQIDECFAKYIKKVQSTIYSLYQIRSNHQRNYVYKS